MNRFFQYGKATLICLLLGHSIPIQAQEQVNTLHNGLKVIIQEDHRTPLVMVQVWYKVGSADEPAAQSGISHALEHMMFQGTIRVPTDELKQLNLLYGGRLNAFTGNNFTYYYQLLPKDYYTLALELEADRMSNLYMQQKDFSNELKVIMEERRQRIDDNPQALAFEKYRFLAYPSSPYRQPVIGSMQNLKNLQLSDLQYWYRTWYAPNNTVLVIVGDVDANQALLQVQRYFGDIPSKALPHRIDPHQTTHSGTRHLDEYSKVKVPNLYMAWNVPSLATAEQAKDAYTLNLIKDILSAGLSSRLNTTLVNKQKVLSAVEVNYEMISRGDSLFTITAVPTEHTSLKTAQHAIEQIIEQLKISFVYPDELQRVQAFAHSQWIFNQDTLQEKAKLIGLFEVNGLDHQLIHTLPVQYQNIYATDIQNIAKRYFQPDNLATLYLQPDSQKIADTTTVDIVSSTDISPINTVNVQDTQP